MLFDIASIALVGMIDASKYRKWKEHESPQTQQTQQTGKRGKHIIEIELIATIHIKFKQRKIKMRAKEQYALIKISNNFLKMYAKHELKFSRKIFGAWGLIYCLHIFAKNI